MKKIMMLVLALGGAWAGFATNAVTSVVDSGLLKEPKAEYRPLQYSDEEWYGSTFWTGSDWTRVGRDWHHPGEQTPSVRRFVCPHDGKVAVEGRVFKLHLSGDGVRAMIRVNDREVWRAELDGVDGKGKEHAIELEVKKGDALRFVVHKRGGIGCDTTGWDPAVTYAGGERYQASAAFAGKKRQGEGGWFYEQEGVGKASSVAGAAVPEPVPMAPAFIREVQAAGARLSPDTEPALLALVAEEWWREDRLDGSEQAYRRAAGDHLARAGQVAADRGVEIPKALGALASAAPATPEAWLVHYANVRLLKRELLLGDPLMGFGELLVCKRKMPSWAHLVAQYYGWRQRGGGGLCAVRRPGRSLETRDLINGWLPEGSYLEPRLSYDAKRLLVAFVACDEAEPNPLSFKVNECGADERYFHLYELDLGVSGKEGVRQLTRGPYDDMMGEYLPDGGIVFCSTRRKGSSRCFGPEYSSRWHNYTLHRANADGSAITTLSYNDVSEWFPAVSHSGDILFARWDYIDRDAVTHQNLWSCRPDGSNPMAVWGNALPAPHCTFQAKPIPKSRKLVFTASAHHAVTGGPICVLDPAVGLNAPEASVRITPLPYPEAEGWKLPEWYESPWPLSERLFLVTYSPVKLRSQGEHAKRGTRNPDDTQRVCLLDNRGNRELLYRDVAINTVTPIPLAAREAPPVLASLLPKDPPPEGEMTDYDIYQGLDGVPRGEIVALRVVQLFPKTTPYANSPRVGVAGEENTRAILGTVPVEADGSARFVMPAKAKVLFQAIDKNGFARRTMRSSTYLQPGEQTSCVGCHVYGFTHTKPQAALPLAMKRPPSRLEPGPLGGRPFGFVETVQPILDAKCVSCHNEKESKGGIELTRRIIGKLGYTASYLSLCYEKDVSYTTKRRLSKKTGRPLVGCYPQRNQIQITPVDSPDSALGSPLVQMLRDGHQKVSLADDDLRRIITWIDLNAVYYGVYEPEEQLALQREGKPVPMPKIQ
ncbi:MAG: hypothetical protein WCJ02_15010 [bacterium]